MDNSTINVLRYAGLALRLAGAIPAFYFLFCVVEVPSYAYYNIGQGITAGVILTLAFWIGGVIDSVCRKALRDEAEARFYREFMNEALEEAAESKDSKESKE